MAYCYLDIIFTLLAQFSFHFRFDKYSFPVKIFTIDLDYGEFASKSRFSFYQYVSIYGLKSVLNFEPPVFGDLNFKDTIGHVGTKFIPSCKVFVTTS